MHWSSAKEKQTIDDSLYPAGPLGHRIFTQIRGDEDTFYHQSDVSGNARERVIPVGLISTKIISS
jgi:hypothetical protein